jgi:AcrR family transcriptional regulator
LQADKMLDAAARLFASQRFHEVRMEDIAAEAAVGKGTLYRYFKDKDELFIALMHRSAGHFQDRIDSLVSGQATARGKLQAIVHGIVEFFDEHPHLFDLLQRAEVMQGPDYPWRQTRDSLLQSVLNTFKEAEKRGEFSIRDPELAGWILLGGMRGVIRFGTQPRAADLAERIVDGIIVGHAEMVVGVR